MPADSSAAAIVALDPAWRPAATESLRLAAAGDGVLYLLTSPSGGGGSSSGSAPSLRRLTLATGEEEVLELSRVSATPAGLFADPHSSTSVLIAHANGDTVYVHRSRSRVLGKARGLLITAVAWLRPDPSRSDTREVLLGSSSGAIFEAALEPTRTPRYRQLFTLSPPAPLCGLAAEPFVSQGAPDDKCLSLSPRAERQARDPSATCPWRPTGGSLCSPRRRRGTTSLWAPPAWRRAPLRRPSRADFPFRPDLC